MMVNKQKLEEALKEERFIRCNDQAKTDWMKNCLADKDATCINVKFGSSWNPQVLFVYSDE